MIDKILLYSGGVDSWLIDKLWNPTKKIYIDIEGRYSNEEISRLPKDVEIVKMPHLSKFEQENAYIPYRNLYFLTVAANYGSNICYGAIYGDKGSKDKSVEFVDKTEDLLNYCTNGTTTGTDSSVHIERRFMKMTKYDLLGEYLKNGGDLEFFVKSTFSCHKPMENKECWACKPCYRKFLLCKYHGYNFDKDIESKMLDYMKENVIKRSNIKFSTYFTEREGEGPYAEKAMDLFFKQYGLNWKDYQ